MEYYRSGIDILCVMPLFVVSQKYRKEEGTLFAPMPIALVKGTFAHLGKKYLWQVNGYWFHTVLQFFSLINPLSAMNSLNRPEVRPPPITCLPTCVSTCLPAYLPTRLPACPIHLVKEIASTYCWL
jgi:hypothetical protein